MTIYTEKIHNDLLDVIKDKVNNGIISQSDIINSLCPPYSQDEIKNALNYISKSQVEKDLDIPAQIVICDSEKTIGDIKTKDKGIITLKNKEKSDK